MNSYQRKELWVNVWHLLSKFLFTSIGLFTQNETLHSRVLEHLFLFKLLNMLQKFKYQNAMRRKPWQQFLRSLSTGICIKTSWWFSSLPNPHKIEKIKINFFSFVRCITFTHRSSFLLFSYIFKNTNPSNNPINLNPTYSILQCITMVQTYGPSMINIIERSGELQTVCTQIGMCFPDEYAAFPLIVGQE